MWYIVLSFTLLLPLLIADSLNTWCHVEPVAACHRPYWHNHLTLWLCSVHGIVSYMFVVPFVFYQIAKMCGYQTANEQGDFSSVERLMDGIENSVIRMIEANDVLNDCLDNATTDEAGFAALWKDYKAREENMESMEQLTKFLKKRVLQLEDELKLMFETNEWIMDNIVTDNVVKDDVEEDDLLL